MNIFKSWRASNSLSKAQKLWEEFKQVSHLKNDPETLLRLKKFLDHVQRSLKEFLEKNESKRPIDDIVGEASDVLASLLQFLSDYDSVKSPQNSIAANEVLNQVLEIAEFILRDPKYKKQIENSPAILNNFLAVADKLEKSESKVILVKLIIMIAENVDSKVSFVQKEGFSKLMRLLLDKDERVSRVISRALLHFLQIDNSDESRLLNEMKGQIEEKEEFNSLKTKLKKIAVDFRKFTFSEIQRIFLQSEVNNNTNNNPPDPKQVLGTTNNNADLASSQKTLKQLETSELRHPPSYEDMFETDLRMLIALQINRESGQNDLSNILSNEQLEITINSAEQIRLKSNSVQQQQQQQQQKQFNSHPGSGIGDELDVQNSSANQNSNNNNNKQNGSNNNNESNSDQSDDIFTILQGGFKAILCTLTPAASHEVQLNLISTIQKLLSNEDIKYKNEFKRLKGYEQLTCIFNRSRTYFRNTNDEQPSASSNNNNLLFLENLFKLYMDIIVGDPTKSNQIVNFDAFEQLNILISTSPSFEVLLCALDHLKVLFKRNWKNLIIARRLKISYHLLAITLRLFETEDNQENSVFDTAQIHSNAQNNHVQQSGSANTEDLRDIDTACGAATTSGSSNPRTLSDPVDVGGGVEGEPLASLSILEGLKSIYRSGNGIYHTSESSKKNEPIGTRQREELLEKINDIFRLFAFVEGTFSTELEYAFSEIILSNIALNHSKNKVVYFLDMLIEFLELKAPRRCSKMFTFDNRSTALIDLIKQIALTLLGRIKSSSFTHSSNEGEKKETSTNICLTDEDSMFYLSKIIMLTEKCMSCDHSQQIENEERMKQLERENTLIKYIICRNQCEETKNIIQEKYISRFPEKEETLLLMRIIDINRMKTSNQSIHMNIGVIAVLKDILINNPARAIQFIQNDGFSLLAYLAFKVNQNMQFMEKIGLVFIDLGLNLNNSQAVLSDPLLKANDKKIPIVEAKRMQWVNAMFSSLFSVNFNDSHHTYFEYLSRLLLHSENMKLFKSESATLSFILEMLSNGRVSSAHNNLYTQVLSLFERFVAKLTANEFKQVLDHLLNNQNLNNLGKPRRTDTAFFTDQLSILAIHMLLKTTPLILEKIITDKYIQNLFGLLDSPNTEVKEMVLKFILVSMSLYSKSKKKEGYGKKEQFYYLLGKKLLAGNITQNICKILYDFTFWEDSPNILYPYNSSVVSTLFNRSEQAGLIMQKSLADQAKTAKIITNIDMLELFFKVLRGYEPSRCTNENAATFRNEMLTVFEVVLDEPTNINLILEQSNFLNWFYVMLPQNWRSLSEKRWPNSSVQHNNSSSQDKDTTNQAMLAANQRPPAPIVSEFVNSVSNSNNFHTNESADSSKADHSQTSSQQEPQVPSPMPSVIGSNSMYSNSQAAAAPLVQCRMEKEKVFGIIHKLMLHYFHKRSGGSEFIDMMRHYIHNDDEFLVAIAHNFFNDLLHNCIVKDDPPQNFLKKFKDFVDNIDVIVGFDAEISILILQCIIRMVSKNSPNIRSIMKELKLFDKRDTLIIRILTYDLDGDTFVKVFEGISFEALANHKEFHDKHTLSSIVKILIEKSNNFSLQMILISILKNPTFSEKNQKYIIDLLDQAKIIQFFYPSFKRSGKQGSGSLAKCLQSNQNTQNTKQNNSQNDDNEVEDDSIDDDHKMKSFQHRGASFETDFLHEFYSEAMTDIRKQILLRINVNLTPVLKQYEIEDKKTKKKRDESKSKYVEADEKDHQNARVKRSGLELEISEKLAASTDSFAKKQKELNELIEKKLTEGENLFEKLVNAATTNVVQQPLQIPNK